MWNVLLLFSLCGGNTAWAVQTGPKLWVCGLCLDAGKRDALLYFSVGFAGAGLGLS